MRVRHGRATQPRVRLVQPTHDGRHFGPESPNGRQGGRQLSTDLVAQVPADRARSRHAPRAALTVRRSKTGGAAPLCAITVLPNHVVESKDVPLYTL
jgi:hypothetical protein